MVILFDIFPASGHFNASLKLAKLLRENGHQIYYCSLSVLSPVVEKNGFAFYGVFDDLKISTSLKDEQIDQIVKEYDLLIAKIAPDMVILDQQQMHKYVFYKTNNICRNFFGEKLL
jgi:UDP:flavonoid glycosyltransferase YjiC (YdhE family)